MNDHELLTVFVKVLLNRDEMLHGFRERGTLTPEIEELPDDELDELVATNIAKESK